MTIRLEVRTQERKWVETPEGFCSTDEDSELLIDFCRRHDIPYSHTFVSVWAMPANSSQLRHFGGGRSTWIPRNADAYGKEIIVLGERVVDSLSLVTCGDFQNTIVQATRLEEAGNDVQSYLDGMLFVFHRAMSRAQRIAQLEEASAKARQLSRLGDAEARLLRALQDSDKGSSSETCVGE